MDIELFFPSNYVAAADLGGIGAPPIAVTIDRVVATDMPGDNREAGKRKAVVYFREARKGLLLNKTNKNRIKALYGAETDRWLGRQIWLYASECDYKGETVPCVRVRPEAPDAQPLSAAQQPAFANNGLPAHNQVAPQPAAQQPATPALAATAPGAGPRF